MCKVDNCNNRNYSHGYCDKHYKELKSYGKILTTKEKCQKRISEYDKEIIYLSGYENCNSIVKCYCNRCKNTFERKWYNIARHKDEYRCPICQTKLGQARSKANNKPTITPVEERESRFIKRLSQKNNQLTYVGGYINSDKSVLLECNICGYRFKRNANGIRGKKNYTCPKCQEKEKSIEKETEEEIEKLLKEQKQYIRQTQAKKNKEIHIINVWLHENTLYIKKCVRCDEEYIGKSKSKYCPECRHRVRSSHSCKSLKKLYDRDNGICKICNGICNWNDKKEVNGTTIVGNTYPSIDHIIPLSKGGTDDWENLQLAHFKCNWVKGAC